MSTPYSNIYERAMFRFSDKKFAYLSTNDQHTLLSKYLMMAVSDFQNKCKQDLTLRDDDIQEFDEDLDTEVQEILALGISYYWLSAQVMNTELLKNKLSTKDYTYFSPANLLREINVLKNAMYKEYKHRIIAYTYDHGDVAMTDRGAE